VSPPLALGDGAVHVWDATVAGMMPLRVQLEATLSEGERRRAEQYRLPRDRDAFALRRGLLRGLVGAYAGMAAGTVALDETCAICGGDHGKPRMAGRPDLDFSVSHSDGRILCAFTRGVAVGVDVERVDEAGKWAGPARRALSAAEHVELDALPAERRAHRFYVLWARKEALAKATGHGIVLPLREIDLTAGGQVRALPEAAGAPGDWAVHDLDAGDPFAAAVAVRDPAVRVRRMGAPDLQAALAV
jgi:4'-phosphopantetheinyl transferase